MSITPKWQFQGPFRQNCRHMIWNKYSTPLGEKSHFYRLIVTEVVVVPHKIQGCVLRNQIKVRLCKMSLQRHTRVSVCDLCHALWLLCSILGEIYKCTLWSPENCYIPCMLIMQIWNDGDRAISGFQAYAVWEQIGEWLILWSFDWVSVVRYLTKHFARYIWESNSEWVLNIWDSWLN